MRTILVVLVSVVLFASTVTVQAQEQAAPVVVSQTMTWAQFLEKFERWQGGNATGFWSVNEDPQPEIARVLYQSRTPVPPFNLHNVLQGSAWFAMRDYQNKGIPAFIIMTETTEMRGGSHTGKKFQFWKGAGDRFTLMSEVRARAVDLPVNALKQFWADDSPEMLAFHQWLDSLGNTKRVRFRFFYYRSSDNSPFAGSIVFRTTYSVPLAP